MSDAVFQEVLTVSVNTTPFNSQIEAMITKYQNAMAQMSAAGNGAGGSAFAGAAAQLNQLGKAADDTAGLLGKVGTAFENAAIRVPARMAVFAALGLAFAALAAPIKLVVDGFQDLAESQEGEGFRSTEASLISIGTRLEELAAKPVFDTIAAALKVMNKWLIDNKDVVDSLAYVFGQALNSAVKEFFALFSGTSGESVLHFFEDLGIDTTIFVTAMLDAASTIKYMFSNIAALAQAPLDFSSWTKFTESFKANWASMRHDITVAQDTFLTEINQHGQEQSKAIAQFLNPRAVTAPDVPEKYSGETTGQVSKAYSDELEKKKAAEEKYVESVKDLQDAQQSNAKDTYLNIKAYHDAEKKSVAELTDQYKELARESIRHTVSGVDKQSEAIKASDASYDKRETSFGVTLDKGDERNKVASIKEAISESHKDAEAQLKEFQDRVAAASAENERSYQANKESTEVFYAQKRQEIDQKFADEANSYYLEREKPNEDYKAAHNGEDSPTYKDTPAYAEYTRKIDAAGHDVVRAQNANDSAESIQQQKDLDIKEQQRVVLTEILVTQLKVTATSKEELGHRKDALTYLKAYRAGLVDIAKTKALIADNQLSRLDPSSPKYAEASNEALKAHLAIGNAQVSAAKEAGADAISDGNPLLAHTAALKAEITELTNMKDRTQAASDMLTDLQSAGQKFAAALQDVNQITGELKNGVNDYISGAGRGHSVLGGVGAVLSDSGIDGKDGLVTSLASKLPGMLGDTMSKMVPMIGPLIGTMFSTVSQLLSAGVQKMVDAINQKIQDIQNSVSSGQIGIGQEITELQQVKQQAISELGGSKKKGAQDQLNAILKTLNAQIGALLFQQQQVIQNFNNMTKAGGLDTLSGTFASWYQTWDGINAQVKAYVDAGGSIATANQYLNQQLEIQRQTLTNQLAQGDQTALQDAIALNQVLTQRSELMKQEAQTEFGIINSDSIERRTSAAVAAGTQLSQQRYNYQQQLLQMNAQITLDQERLSIEGKIFDVAGTLQQLQAKSNADNISALNQQLAQYRDMQTILNSTKGMTFSGPISNSPEANLPIPGESSVAGNITFAAGSIVVTGKLSKQEASDIGVEIGKGIRSGRTSMGIAA